MTLGQWMARFPWVALGCVLALLGIGLAGISRGDELTGLGVFFDKQAVWIALALPMLFAATVIPYRAWKPYAYLWFAISLLLLLAVFAFAPKWGSRRWIPFPFMNLQPSELAKLAYVVTLARYLSQRENLRTVLGLVPPFAMMLVPMGLILKEPDLGTALMFVPILFAMLFAAGAKTSHLSAVILLGVLLSPVLWSGMNAEQRSRVTALFQQRDGEAQIGDGYHLHQSKQVLSLGGPWGSYISGTPVDDPHAYYLPACRTDFVLCMIGERFGVAGTWLVLALYILLFGLCLRIAAATREPFGRLICVGVVALLGSQTVINSAMTVGLMPITGITLPLVSYGGSSLLFTAVAIGLVFNVGLRPGYEITREPFRFASSRPRLALES